MKSLAEEIMTEMEQISYVPVEAEALVVIAFQLKRIADALTSGDSRASF